MSKDKARIDLITLLHNQIQQIKRMTSVPLNTEDIKVREDHLINSLEANLMGFSIITKIELGDDVLAEIKRLKGIIKN